MNDYQNDAYLEDEEEIDLKDLINNALFNNLKKIIIVTIIGGLLGLGFSLYKSNREDRIVAALLENQEAALEKYEDDVTEADIRDVNNYVFNLKLYEMQSDYIDNSILSDLVNANRLYSYKASIRVKNVKDLNGVIEVIKDNVFTDDYLNSIGEKLNIENKSEYQDLSVLVNDLISVNPLSDGSNSFLGTTDKTICVSFIYDDMNLAKEIGEDIVERINSLKSSVYEESGASLYILTTTTTTTTSLTDITGIIQGYEENVDTLYTNLEAEYKAFNNVQLKYYAALNPDEDVEIHQGSLKYSAIGLAVGFVLICGLYVAVYIMSDKLHTTDELEYLGFKVYGLTGKRNKELLKNANVVEANVINKLISLDLKNNGSEEVVIASTLDLKDIEDIVSNIRKDIKVTDVYDDMFNNLDFINKCKEDINIILVEKRNVTKKSDMYHLRQMIKDYELNVLGSVIDNG